jgi:CheY-like chemotaxis protein
MSPRPHSTIPPVLAEQRLRIALADDDREMRRFIAEELSAAGHSVVEVQGGDELLQLLRACHAGERARIDLVVSDIRMPGRTGLSVLQELRAASWAVPFIVMTSFGDEAAHAEAKRLGALAVFDKPLDIEELLRVAITVVRA